MPDDYHTTGKNDNAAKALGIIGIILASLALALAWLAYNRAGENLGQQVQDGTETLQQNLEQRDTNNDTPTFQENQDTTTESDTDLQQGDGTTTEDPTVQ